MLSHAFCLNRVRKNAPTIWKRGSANLVYLVNSIILNRLAHHCQHLHLNFINRCSLLLFLCLNSMEELPPAWEWPGLLYCLVHMCKGLMVLYFFPQGLSNFLDGIIIRSEGCVCVVKSQYFLHFRSHFILTFLNWCRHFLALNLLLGLLLYMEWPSCHHQHQLLLDHIHCCPLPLAFQEATWRNNYIPKDLVNQIANTIWEQGTVNLD